MSHLGSQSGGVETRLSQGNRRRLTWKAMFEWRAEGGQGMREVFWMKRPGMGALLACSRITRGPAWLEASEPAGHRVEVS